MEQSHKQYNSKLFLVLLLLVFAQLPSIPKESIEKVESTAFGIFAPRFFAGAGLKLNLFDLFQTNLILIGVALILVAIFSKIIGAYLGSRLLTKTDHWTALSFGAGLNARGTIQIIVATIGLSFGILSQEIYSLIIITAVVTSLMAPVMLRWTLSHVKPEAQEIKRLQQEELLKDNLLVRVHCVLLPVRKRDLSQASLSKMIEARILERIGRKTDLDVTLLTISDERDKAESQQFLNTLAGFFTKFPVTKKIAESINRGDDRGVTTIDTPGYKQSWGGMLTRARENVESGALTYEETTDKRLLLAGD